MLKSGGPGAAPGSCAVPAAGLGSPTLNTQFYIFLFRRGIEFLKMAATL